MLSLELSPHRKAACQAAFLHDTGEGQLRPCRAALFPFSLRRKDACVPDAGRGSIQRREYPGVVGKYLAVSYLDQN